MIQLLCASASSSVKGEEIITPICAFLRKSVMTGYFYKSLVGPTKLFFSDTTREPPRKELESAGLEEEGVRLAGSPRELRDSGQNTCPRQCFPLA